MIQLLFVDGNVANPTMFMLNWFNLLIEISRPACTTKKKTISSYATLLSAVYAMCDVSVLMVCRLVQSKIIVHDGGKIITVVRLGNVDYKMLIIYIFKTD